MYRFLFRDDKVTVEENVITLSNTDCILPTIDGKGWVMYSEDGDVTRFYNKLTQYFEGKFDEYDSIAKKYAVLKSVVEDLKRQPLNCPFCNGEAKSINYNCLTYKVKCKTCGCETKNCETEREAVDAWNKRV